MIKNLKIIFNLFGSKVRLKLMLLFCMMLLASFLEVLGIGLIPVFIVAVSDPDIILKYPLAGEWLSRLNITTQESLVLFGAAVLMVVYISKNVFLGFLQYFKKRFVVNRGVEMQNRLFRAYMGMPYTIYIVRNSAELLRNVKSETVGIVNDILMPFMNLVLHAIMSIIIISLLLATEPIISLAIFLILGLTGIVFLAKTKAKISEYGIKDKDLRKVMNRCILQGLAGFKDARVLGREMMFLNEYSKFAQEKKKAHIYLHVVQQLPKPITETLAVLSILVITIILLWQGRSITVIIPVLALFGAASLKLMPIINAVVSNISAINYNVPSISIVDRDLRLLEKKTSTLKSKENKKSNIVPLNKNLSIQGISFRYPNTDDYAIKNISLDIGCGEAVAFVGESGAGKTTMVDIILGLLEPQEGVILVDGKDIRDNIRGWQKNIGYIPQSIFLLDDTIRRNIAFGIPDDEINEEKLNEALEAAQLKDLIARLPEGEETIVGERGIRISGGQRQRIGIARALYNKPQVLIMDEATSALDNITEKYVIEAIEHLKRNLTIITIAHRLTTVINCDRLYLMQEGRIIAQGGYESLLENNIVFRKMAMKK